MRIALGIQYDGTAYHGWQLQAGLVTLQATIEAALSRVADQPVTVVAAGRTVLSGHIIGPKPLVVCRVFIGP